MLKTTCIMCPLGCELVIEKNKKDIQVSGNTCVRGLEYGKNELTNPVRNISTLMKIKGGEVVPVKTDKTVPKAKIEACLKVIGKVILDEKPKMGSVVIKNILGLGVDVVCIGY